MDTSTATDTATGEGANATKEPNVGSTSAASEAAAAATQDPLANSAASTAFTGTQTISPEAGGISEGQDSPQATSAASGGMSEGTNIGIGVGVGVGAAVIIALIALFFIMRKRRKNEYSSHPSAENMRGQPAMTSTEPALAAVSALGRSPSYHSNNRSSYHSLAHTSPPPLPDSAIDPMAEANIGTILAQPTIIPPSQQSLPYHSPEAETPRGRRSMEAEAIPSPGTVSLATPAPPYDDTPSPVDGPPSRPVSPVSPVSPMGSRPGSLRRSFESSR